MMTSLDTKLVPKTKTLIEEFGKEVAVTVFDSEDYNPTTGETTFGEASEFTVKVSPPQNYEDRYIDGDLVEMGDVKVFLAAEDVEFTPVKGLQVVLDGEIWKIVRIQPIYTGELIALYELQMRK